MKTADSAGKASKEIVHHVSLGQSLLIDRNIIRSHCEQGGPSDWDFCRTGIYFPQLLFISKQPKKK